MDDQTDNMFIEVQPLADAFAGGVFRARLVKFGGNVKRKHQDHERTVWASFELDNTAAVLAFGEIPEGVELGEDVHPLSVFEAQLKELMSKLYASAGEK